MARIVVGAGPVGADGMVSLKAWMLREGVSDDELAERIGGISPFTVRKLRFRERGPSARVAARLYDLTAGEVRPPDLLPLSKSRPASAAMEASS